MVVIKYRELKYLLVIESFQHTKQRTVIKGNYEDNDNDNNDDAMKIINRSRRKPHDDIRIDHIMGTKCVIMLENICLLAPQVPK